MKTLAALIVSAYLALVLIALPATVTGCAHGSAGGFVKCMQDAGASAALINTAENLLGGENYVAALDNLALVVGPEAVICALKQITGKVGVSGADMAKAQRAKRYLDAHGAQ